MTRRYEAGALILRLVLGITFFIHGLIKFHSGIGNIAGWFESMGLPGFAAYVVAIIEVVGGIAMVLGIGTPIVSILFALVLVGAIVMVKGAAGFTGNGKMGGYEFELALLAMSIYLAINGSRLYALDSFFRKTVNE
ncbi:DoxX family protein [Aneurinibacillus terranovensis]|uniref:DoxX family protein n=1 Tax=Aneurinibacillus terranovensis TaxID=278991 RepID=UPI000421C35A|nr:DoxX family protein [Aneurinibacillus terranovensis]